MTASRQTATGRSRHAHGTTPSAAQRRSSCGESCAQRWPGCPSASGVVTLRDVDGLGPEEVCGLLGISAGSERVLRHRGRTRLREALAGALDAEALVV